MIKGLAFLVLLIALIAAFGGSRETNKPAPAAQHTVTIPPPPDPRTLVTIADYTWGKVGFGTVGQGNFTIKNDNAFPVKDVHVRCSFYGNSGTQVSSSDATIFEVVGAKKSRTFKEVNLGFIHPQSTKASCRVIDVGR